MSALFISPEGSAQLAASKKVWKVVTLEWPPHTCSECPDGGIALKFLRDIFERSGEKIEVTFLPWRRARRGFRAGHFDLIYPLWIWEYNDLGLKSKPESVYHSTILMIRDVKSTEPFCIVGSYNYGPKIEEWAGTGFTLNKTAHTDEQCLKLIQSGRASGTLLDRIYLDMNIKKGFQAQNYQVSTYDQGDLYLGHQDQDDTTIRELLRKSLVPYRANIQKQFEEFVKSMK